MKKTHYTTAKKGNPATKLPSDGPSEQPPVPTPFPVLDIRSEWRPTSVPEPPTVRNSEEEAFLKELEEKFGSKEEAVRLFSQFTAFRQQPQAIPEESEAPPLSSNLEGPQTLDPTHAETGLRPDIGEQGRDGGGTEEESVSGFADEIDRMAVEYSMDGATREGNASTLQLVEGGTPVVKSMEGETPNLYVEGGTPFESEGKLPTEPEEETPEKSEEETLIVSEGAIPKKSEEETPHKSTGETPVTFAEGEIPMKAGGDEVPIVVTEQRPREDGPVEVVNLDEMSADSPVNRRESRRMARRSLLDEIKEDDQSRGSGFLAPGAASMQEEETPESEEEVDAEEERRVARERKRKGKKASTSQPRKSQRLTLVREAPHALQKAPGPGEVDSESEGGSEGEEVPNFAREEVWLTKKLLVSMTEFDDAKRAQTHKDRSAVGKLAKSGKRYDPESLQHIESEEEFLGHIRDIGFEWLLRHSEQEVPVDAAREFFSTFRFKASTDQDTISISFRLFSIEHTMSVREWSLRMGLFTNEEDAEGIWDDRAYGPPKNTPGFTPQTAWESITHARSGVFKTSVSKGIHITDHLLRFAQEFIGYNLMGTASSALTTTELYFTWCMSKRIKVHLGFWLAQACHQMATNPSRHMYTCHLLGAYIERNFVMKFGKAEPRVMMCDPPELFSLEYFFNKGLLHMDGEEVCFYDVGANVDKVKHEPDLVEEVGSADVAELRKEMVEAREEIGGVKKALLEIKGSLDTLAERSSAQNDRMTEAVKIMKRMAEWLGEVFPQTQKKPPSGPSTMVRQQGPGSSFQKQLPLPSRPLVAPHASPALASVSARKPLSRTPVLTEEDAPALPAKKKVKVNRPIVPPRSGSQGGQTQN